MLTVWSRIKYIKVILDQPRITLGKVYTITKIEQGCYCFADDMNVQILFTEHNIKRAMYHFKDVTRLEKLQKITERVQHQR